MQRLLELSQLAEGCLIKIILSYLMFNHNENRTLRLKLFQMIDCIGDNAVFIVQPNLMKSFIKYS